MIKKIVIYWNSALISIVNAQQLTSSNEDSRRNSGSLWSDEKRGTSRLENDKSVIAKGNV